jgi:hypothetical protein
MLTGSGVALILRLVGMDSGDYWSWSGWHYFALIAGFSVLSKHLIRYRGSHVFNPSNFGLVVAFLLLGSTVVEPLDFWWAPMSFWMALTYLIIVAGGIVITRRLQLLEMAVAFWVVLAIALGVLAASGHCMTATWSPTPVCGAQFWSVLVTSPEVLIFLFFMITDPKTVPIGRLARLTFAAALAVVATVLMAPQSVEFATKVALLGSLVVLTPLRGVFERLMSSRNPARSGLGDLFARLISAGGRPLIVFGRGAAVGSLLVLVAMAIVAAGSPARQGAQARTPAPLPEITVEVDPATVPAVSVSDEVYSLNAEFDETYIQGVAVILAENLAIEGEAIREGDGGLLAAADADERLVEMQAKLDEAIATGERVVARYEFDALEVYVAETEEGQAGAALGFEGSGTVAQIVHDAVGVEQSITTSEFALTFVMRQLGDRWLIVSTQPAE